MPATLTTPARTLPYTRIKTAFGLLHAWHLLSLDAPTVAVLWTAFFARTRHLTLPATELVALFLAVWLLYVADRILDASPAGQATSPLQPRHLFHRMHRRAFLATALPAAIALIPLSLHVPSPDLHLDLLLAAALLVWFLLIHRIAPTRRFPKELTTGLFFAVATTIPTFTRQPAPWLAAQAALFAALCTLNGLFISSWESACPAKPQVPIKSFALALAVTSSAFALLIRSPAALAVALAAAALLALERTRTALEPTTLRAAADLALLTPILVWPLLR